MQQSMSSIDTPRADFNLLCHKKHVSGIIMAHTTPSENGFLVDPVRVVVYDPIAGTSLCNYVFLGDVPKGIRGPARGV